MNANELTLDGYLGLAPSARMSVARVPLPHTADRWEEGEQHVNPFMGGCYHTPRRAVRTEQDALWDCKIWVELTVDGGGLVSKKHWEEGLSLLVACVVGRTVRLKVV